jgi:hypothetical protein
MPEPPPVDDPLLIAGIASAPLISDPQSWINRRVETIELLSHEETRRQVSIDFTLSDDQLDELTIDQGVVVPISVLSKERRRNFSLRDESGRAIPVLGKDENGELAHTALLSAAYDALPEQPSQDVFDILAADLRQVVFGLPEEADATLDFIIASANGGDRWRAAIIADEACMSLLNALWANYVLYAVLAPNGPNRRVLKYSYGEGLAFASYSQPLRGRLARLAPRELVRRAWTPDRNDFVIECPSAWRAASFHAEIAIPEEVRFELAVLWDFHAARALSAYDLNVDRAALYAPDVDSEDYSTAFAVVAIERAGRVTQAALTCAVAAGLLWLGVESGLDAKNPGPAISILLAGAALFSSVAAVQGEHRLVKRVFAASRRWLVLTTLAALVASAALALEVPDTHPVGLWRVAAILCSVATVRLGWSAVRAPR